MSKRDNLKDYLTDLYQGIASKKPGASRNPQDFRAEIESIQTGGGGSSSTLIEKTFAQNGTYFASSYGADGFSKVIVDTEIVDTTTYYEASEFLSDTGGAG